MDRGRAIVPPLAACYLLSCFFFGGKGRVSLLPQELSGPQERLRVLELPSLVGGENKKRTRKNPSKSLGCI